MKKKMILQLFAEAVKGKKLIYLYRIHEKAAEATGTLIAFVTENSKSISVDADSTETKDGTIRTPGEPEIEVSATSILTVGDTFIDELEDAMVENKLMDIWEVNLAEGVGTNKFKGRYYQGYLTEFEKSSNAEDFVEVQLTFGINGDGAKGDVTVTQEQQETANYVFSDTTYGLTASKLTSAITRSSSATTDPVDLTNIVGTAKVVVTGDTGLVSASLGTITSGAATLTITAKATATGDVGGGTAKVKVTDAAGYYVVIDVTVAGAGA